MKPEESSRLIALFNAGCFNEVEALAGTLLIQYPEDGFAWKALSLALQEQGKDALQALSKSAQLLPGDAAGHCNLAAALLRAGRFEEAAASCRTALALMPDFLEALCNLAIALQNLDLHEQAVASFRHALRLNSNLPHIHDQLGNSLQALGRHDEAIDSFCRALEIDPQCVAALSGMGNAYCELGNFNIALVHCQRALAIQPDFAPALNNLGNALQGLRRFDEAVASYRLALVADARAAVTHNNLGNALCGIGQYEEAAACFLRALEIKPTFPEAHNNLGIARKHARRLEDAVASFQRAIELRPEFAEAYGNLGEVLNDLGRIDAALASFRRALEIKPDLALVHANLGSLRRNEGQFDDALIHYRRALELKPDYLNARSNLLFTLNYQLGTPAPQLLEEAMRYGEVVAQQAKPYSSWGNAVETDRVLRIGLVSGDLRSHPVGYFIESVLRAFAAFAESRLHCTAYANYLPGDAVTARIRQHCQVWHDVVGWSDEHLAQQIHSDSIDILIDLSGHTAFNRLPVFAWKAAPVQASWLGYFGTTGVDAIDYLIADPWTLMPEDEPNFSEKISRLPETRLCFTAPDDVVEVNPLPALERGYVMFGCFSNLSKLNDSVVECWADIMRALPGSRLLLKAKQLSDLGVRKATQERFARHGIGAERLVLEGPEGRSAYLAAYRRVDLILDTFPFPGGTTTVEALWMGVPVLTLAGKRFLERQGIGLLMNAGLPDWVAVDLEDYKARALAHSADLRRLAALRAGLRAQLLASPLCNADLFARHFEQALRGMWRQWIVGAR